MFYVLQVKTPSTEFKCTERQLILPDKSQGNDIVRVDSYKPVTVFAVWIGVWVVGREDESRRASHIPTTRSLRDYKKEEEINQKDAYSDHTESL